MAYVYRHIRLDKNVPFYIGIGENKYRHSAKQNRNIIWNKIVAKTEWESEIILDNVTWEDACQKEIEFIKLYGRINKGTGTLANMTDGGDGNLGLSHSPEAIKKISEASKSRPGYWKGKKMPEEVRKKLSTTKTGVPNYKLRGRERTNTQIEAVRKHSYGNKYNLGKRHTEESKKKMSEKMKGRVAYNKGKPGLFGELNGMFGKKHTEESKKKNSDSQKKRIIIKYTLEGLLVQEYHSITEAATLNKCFSTGIQAVCKGRTNSYKGFLWKYKQID